MVDVKRPEWTAGDRRNARWRKIARRSAEWDIFQHSIIIIMNLCLMLYVWSR